MERVAHNLMADPCDAPDGKERIAIIGHEVEMSRLRPGQCHGERGESKYEHPEPSQTCGPRQRFAEQAALVERKRIAGPSRQPRESAWRRHKPVADPQHDE